MEVVACEADAAGPAVLALVVWQLAASRKREEFVATGLGSCEPGLVIQQPFDEVGHSGDLREHCGFLAVPVCLVVLLDALEERSVRKLTVIPVVVLWEFVRFCQAQQLLADGYPIDDENGLSSFLISGFAVPGQVEDFVVKQRITEPQVVERNGDVVQRFWIELRLPGPSHTGPIWSAKVFCA